MKDKTFFAVGSKDWFKEDQKKLIIAVTGEPGTGMTYLGFKVMEKTNNE